MVAIRISIFVLSLVLFEAVNGERIRIADYKENDSNIEMLLAKGENERSNLLLKRLKRVSDQRLAELETLYTLNKINIVTSTGRSAYIKINPELIGRRKRSTRENLYETKRIGRRTSESIKDEILIR
ncbi:uncharacterized protein LOC118445158 [Vespa mandarinia]|uniref:uncharacterized protein LOC118445158 n=1 Tax=Vespa mandarinia TaxID=7446 RepID=UPI00160FADD7|nr:uncharacterized protein LOC118445158 [Vespa mandarinia]